MLISTELDNLFNITWSELTHSNGREGPPRLDLTEESSEQATEGSRADERGTKIWILGF